MNADDREHLADAEKRLHRLIQLAWKIAILASVLRDEKMTITAETLEELARADGPWCRGVPDSTCLTGLRDAAQEFTMNGILAASFATGHESRIASWQVTNRDAAEMLLYRYQHEAAQFQ